jgi:hypothetical protein
VWESCGNLGWKRHLHRCPDPTVDLHVELESRLLLETVRQRIEVGVAATATLMAPVEKKK